jgi:hypothetical protein
MVRALELLDRAVDVHIHAGPSLMARQVDAWESAQQAIEANLAAIVIKDHHLPSVGAATTVSTHLRGVKKLKVFGSIALNSPVGGLNPKAVEVAIGFGAKVVWLTTVSCQNHIDKHSGHGFKFPPLKQPLTVPEKPLRYLDAHGNLIPEAVRVIEVMAEHPDVVLATGHGNRDEIDAIIRKAASIGLKRILVDHPYYMIEASLEDMKAWRSLGAYIEFTAVTSVPESNLYCIPLVDIAGYIKALGSERLILSSDYGQVGNGRPVDGLAAFAEHLLDQGIEERVLRKMLTENPSQLLNL